MNGFVFYRGPSMIDGSPIVAIATGVARGSRNAKTGGVVQTWIMRADMGPVEAVNRGADASVCGACPHRGRIEGGRNTGRTCYVVVFQAPRSVWSSWQRGIYSEVSPANAGALLAGKMVRLGSYGDPAAVPADVWRALLAEAGAHTGYTHQWERFPELAAFCMASCDSPQDFHRAKAAGWRTFRIRLPGEALERREIVCPASEEAGHKTECGACRACGGHAAKARADVAIVAHGAAGKLHAYEAWRRVA